LLNAEKLIQDGYLVPERDENRKLVKFDRDGEYAGEFILIRSGQLAEEGTSGVENGKEYKILHGLGRKIKLKPKF
jgi:hypothetical protein